MPRYCKTAVDKAIESSNRSGRRISGREARMIHSLLRDREKSAGQLAYEADCLNEPNYHDGRKRKSWFELPALAQWSWNREPTPRKESEQ